MQLQQCKKCQIKCLIEDTQETEKTILETQFGIMTPKQQMQNALCNRCLSEVTEKEKEYQKLIDLNIYQKIKDALCLRKDEQIKALIKIDVILSAINHPEARAAQEHINKRIEELNPTQEKWLHHAVKRKHRA